MSNRIPPIRPSEQAYRRPATAKVAWKATTTVAANSTNNGGEQGPPNPEGHDWPAVRSRSNNRQAGSFAEIIHEAAERIIS